MELSLSTLVLILSASFLGTNGQECAPLMLADLGSSSQLSTDGLVAQAFVTGGENKELPLVQIFNYTVVCEVAGSQLNTAIGVSVLVHYDCETSRDDLSECSPEVDEVIRQFQFSCSDMDEWTTTVAGTSIFVVSESTSATLDTELDDMCSLCVDPDQIPSDPVTHCVECHPDCNQGQMRCFGPNPDQCCNFYQGGSCVDECNDGLVPDELLQCVCPGLPSPADGMISSSDVAMIGDTVSYSCDNDFILSGPQTRTCTLNGWNGTEPTCSEQVECYTDRNCLSETTPMLMTRRECCVDTPAAVGFKLEGQETCNICVVFGFFQSTFTAPEQGQGYAIPVGYLKRPEAGVVALVFTVNQELLGTTTMGDFTLQTTAVAVLPNQADRQVTFTFHVDAIAQERNELVRLRLVASEAVIQSFSSEHGNTVFFVETADLTIIDSDSLDIFFTEEDYRAAEPELSVNVRVSKNNRIATPVTVMVSPVNISEHMNTGRPFPSQLAGNNFGLSPIEADLNDFDNSVIVVTFQPDETGQQMNDVDTPVSVVNDTINEAEEQDFVVTLDLVSATDNSSLTISRKDALCRIIDDDDIAIGFERRFYTFPEPSGSEETPIADVVFIAKENGVVSEQTFRIAVTVTRNTPDQNTQPADPRMGNIGDYEIPSESNVLRMEPQYQAIPFNFRLFGDDIAEGTEAFQISTAAQLNSSSFLGPTVLSSTTFIIIEDDDIVIIGFERNYSVDESVGMVNICAVATFPAPGVPILSTIFLSVNTTEGTADETDYTRIDERFGSVFLTFGDENRRQCFLLEISDDALVEDTENLTIDLVFSSFFSDPSGVLLDPNVTTVQILDNDAFIVIGWENPVYNVNESSGQVDICAVITTPPSNVELQIGDFNLTVSTEDVTAVADMDYSSLSGQNIGPFGDQNRRGCVTVNITDDDNPELSEDFNGVLEVVTGMGPPPELVTISPATTTVNIEDDDVPIVIGWESPVYNVSEGSGQVEICAVITTPPSDVELQIGDFNLAVSTEDGTAVADMDYSSLSGQIIGPFGDQSRRGCVTVNIIDDDNPELSEAFNGVLEVIPGMGPPPELVIISPTTTTINIEDDGPTPPPVNDTIVGDPLLTAPLLIRDRTGISGVGPDDPVNLCYEVRAKPDAVLNLVSDMCVTVNAHYAQVRPNERLNIIDAIYVRAVDSEGNCHNIAVNLDQCMPSVNLSEVQMLNINGINVRKIRNRVRIAVPNCREQDLVMWVFCQNRTVQSTILNSDEMFDVEMIRFVISRGFSLQESSHGILGQFWNVPIDVERFNGSLVDGSDPGPNAYTVTVNYPGQQARVFVGWLYPITWEKRREYCIYAGNGQGGKTYEVPSPFNDPVLEGRYTDYMIGTSFSTEFKFNHFEEGRCN